MIQIINKKLAELIPYDNNPRVNDAAIEYVAASIQEFGFKVPIIINNDNIIIAGHTRLLAAKLLSLSEAPCIIADDLNDEQIKAFRLVDNKTAELSMWDTKALDKELKSLEFVFDMSDFGFEPSTFAEVKEDDYEITPPKTPKSKPGDIYLLGNHRLMCGDSTDPNDVAKLMEGKQAHLIVTDPPYGMDYKGAGRSKRDGILNDNLSDFEFLMFLKRVYRNIYTSLKEGGSFYIFYKELGDGVFISTLKKMNLTFKQNIIWVKNGIVIGGNKYQNMHEPCLFGCKGSSVKYWYSDRKQKSVIENADLMNELQLRDLIKNDTEGADIIRCNKPARSELHPTMKPIKLLEIFIKNSSKERDVVLDLFSGSGSTLIACEQMNRACYTMELDPLYVDVTIDRWQTFTGQKVVKITG